MPFVLLVDDDEIIREALLELLSEQYRCQTAETAEEAIGRLAVDTYDVVLTDISMPGVSGIELVGHVRQEYPNTPVIIISGISDQEHAQGLLKLGVFEYLLKPLRLEVVEDSVKRALDLRNRLLREAQGSENRAVDGNEWTIVN